MPPAILQKEKSDVSYWVKTQMEWYRTLRKDAKVGVLFLKKLFLVLVQLLGIKRQN